MEKHIVVIGAGPAGLETSAILAKLGFHVTLVEKEKSTGGHLKKWHALFPTLLSGKDTLESITKGLNGNIKIQTATKVTGLEAVNEMQLYLPPVFNFSIHIVKKSMDTVFMKM